jgi:DNA-binding MarR family transcriptional regulator
LTDYLSNCKLHEMSSPSDNRNSAKRTAALVQDLRAVLGKLKRRLREQTPAGDLTPSQVSVLLRLEKDGPATAASLARAEGMRPQSVAPVIAALEGAGLVSGVPDPADGRQTLLSLTEACRQWVEEGRAARQDWLARMLQARLSPHERDEVAKAVELLKRLVDD